MTGMRLLGLVGVVVLTVTLLPGCGEGADPANARESAEVRKVRTDRGPIADRFPALGDFTSVEWVGRSRRGAPPDRATSTSTGS